MILVSKEGQRITLGMRLVIHNYWRDTYWWYVLKAKPVTWGREANMVDQPFFIRIFGFSFHLEKEERPTNTSSG